MSGESVNSKLFGDQTIEYLSSSYGAAKSLKRSASTGGQGISKKSKALIKFADSNEIENVEESVSSSIDTDTQSLDQSLVTQVTYSGATSSHLIYALEACPSMLDIPLPPAESLNGQEKGDLTFEDLFRTTHNKFTKGSTLRVGDKLFVPGADNIAQEIEVTGAFQKRLLPSVPPVTKTSITIAVPPTHHETSDPSRADIIFPSPILPLAIGAPTAIWNAAKNVYPTLSRPLSLGGERLSLWETITAVRGEEDLGTLEDIRLGMQFAKNERDYRSQLDFSTGRNRRLAANVSKSGFYLVDNSALFLKVTNEKMEVLNNDLLLDLGKKLNDELAALANPGYVVIPVDIRTMATDGLPIPLESNFGETLEKGPAAFRTSFTRILAESSGWSRGYAHMGLKALSKNTDGKCNLAGFECFQREPGGAASNDPDAIPVRWTKEESKKVIHFYETKIKGQVRHYPMPLNRSRRHFDVTTTQYRKSGNGWVIDPDVHGNVANDQIISTETFEEARTSLASKISASDVRRTMRVPENDASRYSGGIGAALGYETLGHRDPHLRTDLGARFRGRD